VLPTIGSSFILF